MKSFLPIILSLLPLAGTVLQAQSAPPQPKTTAILVLLTVKQGVTREQVMKVMPAEIKATVQLYLNGKITQWFSRGDGKGVVFLLDARDVSEARTLMEGLPLHKRDFMDYEYIPVGPLMPLQFLAAGSQQEQ
jgi:hypothetical protein